MSYHIEWNPFNWTSKMFSPKNISGFWNETADDLTKACKTQGDRYYIEFNPNRWTEKSFSLERYNGFCNQTADNLTQAFKSEGDRYYIEFNSNKWTEKSFSLERYTGFYQEALEKDPVYRYLQARLSESEPITNLSKEKRTETKFIFDATRNAIHRTVASDNYQLVANEKDPDTGYEVFIQRSDKNKTIIINYKDTDDMEDVIYSDLPMAGGKFPLQLIQAMTSYNEIARKYPDYKIIVTGLSLGGSLSELVASSPEAAKHGNTIGYSFNGYGVAGPVLKSCGKGFKDRGNVTAISAKSDIVVGRAAKHVGKEYIVDTDFDFFNGDYKRFHHISFMRKKMNEMAIDEKYYQQLLNPS